MATGPFTELGLGSDASVDDVQAARRRLARAHHPDLGGDADRMQSINEAADAALRLIEQRGDASAIGPPGPPPRTPDAATQDTRTAAPNQDAWSAVARDMPSFVVEALPVETFEGLLVAATILGEAIDDEPPYRLEVVLDAPIACWCRLDIVPDAGASTVSLTIAGIDGAPTPDVIAVRDAWIATLNAIDWT